MSAPISPASLERLDAMFPNAATVNMYASTESWPARVRTRFDRTRPASVGKPEGSTRVRVVDMSGTEVPTGVTGEVHHVDCGYHVVGMKAVDAPDISVV